MPPSLGGGEYISASKITHKRSELAAEPSMSNISPTPAVFPYESQGVMVYQQIVLLWKKQENDHNSQVGKQGLILMMVFRHRLNDQAIQFAKHKLQIVIHNFIHTTITITQIGSSTSRGPSQPGCRPITKRQQLRQLLLRLPWVCRWNEWTVYTFY